jgi:diazepam-binding inhibitor (GABA receptor modulating acyl-CoA-binding protein)
MLSSIAARTSPLRRHFSSSLSFTAAQTLVKTLPSEPSNDVKLELYALFKQATLGANAAPRPSSFDYVAAAKWSAWRNVSGMDRAEAEARYAALVAKLTGTAGAAPTAAAAPTAPAIALPGGTGLVYRAQLDAARGVDAVVLNAPPVNALGSRVLGELSAGPLSNSRECVCVCWTVKRPLGRQPNVITRPPALPHSHPHPHPTSNAVPPLEARRRGH